MSDFRLLMISAMYENGGNVTHRLLDGHPELFVYPFESQLGTRLVQDHLTALFPLKYRWPVFDLAATPTQDYRAIIDEECKVRARTPRVSKFRHMPFDFDDDARLARYRELVARDGRSRAGNIAAFFRATFDVWHDYNRTGEEKLYVGYSPIIVVDAPAILADMPEAHILHVVRNPWSAYADTKKRPVPLALSRYMTTWAVTQYHALVARSLAPDRVHVVRFEDVIVDPRTVLGGVCRALGLPVAERLTLPTWNGRPLEEVYPWGTIRRATPAANAATARELSAAERAAVATWAGPYLAHFDYEPIA